MSRNLQILDQNLGISCNVKYDPLHSGEKDKAKITYKCGEKEVKLCVVDQNRRPTVTFKAYLDQDGKEYAKQQLVAFNEAGEALDPYEATTVFNIVKYEPSSYYTDRYIVEKYYEIAPSDDGKKKDIDRKIAADLNTVGMKKLYDYLTKTNTVAKAEFISTSGVYAPGAGYIRAITVDNGKWTLELGVFKQEKIFKHLQEPIINVTQIQQPVGKKKTNALI